MKKTLIAMAVLAAAGAAQAQSNVTIYGSLDAGYVKSTGNSLTMDSRYDNRLGFMGSEELGGGLKATFQLEHRFNGLNGVSKGRGDFEGAANVGLAGAFGQVRFGRVNELATENFRVLDPFMQYGVAGQVDSRFRGMDQTGRLSYTARWDSLSYNGFKLGATYTVQNGPDVQYPGGTSHVPNTGGSSAGLPNNGYAFAATYTNGPMYLVGNYEKPADSSSSYLWNVGGAYAFGPAKVSAGYEEDKNKMAVGAPKEKRYILGLAYTVGAGVVNASFN